MPQSLLIDTSLRPDRQIHGRFRWKALYRWKVPAPPGKLLLPSCLVLPGGERFERQRWVYDIPWLALVEVVFGGPGAGVVDLAPFLLPEGRRRVPLRGACG